jgi:predicted DNA-binding transcriptional regulator AlpA
VAKQPAAQVKSAKKAAALKASADAKRAQHPWLKPSMRALPQSDPPPAPEQLSAAHQSQGPPRLLDKAEILIITRASFPTVWKWMQTGSFPRSRVVGGKSMWLSTEVDEWLAALPLRRLKGDDDMDAA